MLLIIGLSFSVCNGCFVMYLLYCLLKPLTNGYSLTFCNVTKTNLVRRGVEEYVDKWVEKCYII